jgi:YesN/AraC family two-component response regulator
MDITIEIKEDLQQRLGLQTVTGISAVSSELHEIPMLFRQSQEAVRTQFYSKHAQIIQYREIKQAGNDLEGELDLQALSRQLKELISTNEDGEVEAFLDSYLPPQGQSKPKAYTMIFTLSVVSLLQILLTEVGNTLKNIYGEEISIWQRLHQLENSIDAQQLLGNMLKAVREHLIRRNVSQNNLVVQKVKDIVAAHYMEELTVGEISKEIFYSALHANNLFKRETGKTIFDYLTEYRMEKARELLKDPNAKVYMVGQEVGYENKSHFCLVFKKYTGMSPAEYKNKLL